MIKTFFGCIHSDETSYVDMDEIVDYEEAPVLTPPKEFSKNIEMWNTVLKYLISVDFKFPVLKIKSTHPLFGLTPMEIERIKIWFENNRILHSLNAKRCGKIYTGNKHALRVDYFVYNGILVLSDKVDEWEKLEDLDLCEDLYIYNTTDGKLYYRRSSEHKTR